MNRSSKLYAASLLGLVLATVGTASQASTLSTVASTNVGAGAIEAVGALASRVLDPSLQSNVAGSGITDATVTPPSGVPEPETLALFGLGVAALAVLKRRKGRRG